MMVTMRCFRRLISWRRVEIDEVLRRALVLTRRHGSRALRARLWRLQLRGASHQHLDPLFAVVFVVNHGIAMNRGLVLLVVGRLLEISGTVSEAISDNVFAGLDVLGAVGIKSQRALDLLPGRRCGIGGPHRVPPPTRILRVRGRTQGALAHDGPSGRSHWKFDLRESVIDLRHSVRDDVLGQMRGVGRLRFMLRVRRASRSHTGGRRLLLVHRLGKSQHGSRRHRLGLEELDVFGGRSIQRVNGLARRLDVLDGVGRWFNGRVPHGDSDARNSVLDAR